MRLPRLGFLGLGWIGRRRLESVVRSGRARVAALADPDPATLEEAARLAPGVRLETGLAGLLALPLDGLVIATPSGQHAAEALEALEAGVAVFCQKPLARTAGEAQEVVARARRHDRLLDVDLSYRHLQATLAVSALLQSGELGRVYAVDLTFHNAYGPDKPWYYDRSRSGGGCVMDLGIHLLDLLQQWAGPCRQVNSATLLSQGRAWTAGGGVVEDYAIAHLMTAAGAAARLACSWHAPAGRDAVIEATVFGTRGGARVRNVDGSFYDFVAERLSSNRTDTLVGPPDDWEGRAVMGWVDRLAEGGGFDPGSEALVSLAALIDDIYRAGDAGRASTAMAGPGM